MVDMVQHCSRQESGQLEGWGWMQAVHAERSEAWLQYSKPSVRQQQGAVREGSLATKRTWRVHPQLAGFHHAAHLLYAVQHGVSGTAGCHKQQHHPEAHYTLRA